MQTTGLKMKKTVTGYFIIKLLKAKNQRKNPENSRSHVAYRRVIIKARENRK